MQCDKCSHRAVIRQPYSGLRLCYRHFVADFEGKARKAVRFSGGLSGSGHILLALNGDYRGCALVHFLSSLTAKRRGIRLSAALINHGPDDAGYRAVRDLAESRGIPVVSITGARDENPRTYSQGKVDPCQNFRDPKQKTCLEHNACSIGATRIACDTGLDGEALAILVEFLKGEPDRLAMLFREDEGGIPWIRPFLHIPDREIALYARLTPCWNGGKAGGFPADPFWENAKRMLDEYTARHPSAPHALVRLGERLGASDGVRGRGDPHCGEGGIPDGRTVRPLRR